MSTSPIDEIKTLLEQLSARKDDLAVLEGPLTEISVALADMCAQMEKPRDTSMVEALAAGLRGLSITAPAVSVHVPAAAAPEISVSVQPAQVVVMPAPEAPKGWVLTVTSRDGNGQARTISFKPEN